MAFNDDKLAEYQLVGKFDPEEGFSFISRMLEKAFKQTLRIFNTSFDSKRCMLLIVLFNQCVAYKYC